MNLDSLGSVGVIVAARTGSRRLPGKALLPLGGVPMILFLMNRLFDLKQNYKIILATTELPEDDDLAEVVLTAGFDVFRGANEDVIQRYVKAADYFGFDTVVRV